MDGDEIFVFWFAYMVHQLRKVLKAFQNITALTKIVEIRNEAFDKRMFTNHKIHFDSTHFEWILFDAYISSFIIFQVYSNRVLYLILFYSLSRLCLTPISTTDPENTATKCRRKQNKKMEKRNRKWEMHTCTHSHYLWYSKVERKTFEIEMKSVVSHLFIYLFSGNLSSPFVVFPHLKYVHPLSWFKPNKSISPSISLETNMNDLYLLHTLLYFTVVVYSHLKIKFYMPSLRF